MSAKSGLPDIPQRISVVCACGEKLLANSMQSGKRLKCPSCGQAVVVSPARADGVPTPTGAVSAPRRGMGKLLLMILLWSLPVFAAVGGGAVLHFDAKWRQQAKIDAANTEVREAVKGADSWLKQGSPKEAENVERRLTKAMAANDVSVKGNADGVRAAVQTRRAELAADSVFDAAKTKLDAKAIAEAVALLHQYIADRHATQKPAAQQLLADCELATSDAAALKTLMALSDERFAQFKNTGKLDDTGKLGDHKFTRPILDEIRATTLRHNLKTANERREEIKLAEANRQQAERMALAAPLRAADNAQAAKQQPAIDSQTDQAKEGTKPATPSTDDSSSASKRPAAENSGLPPAKETAQYIKEQIRALKSGQSPFAAADAAKQQPAPKRKKRVKTPKDAFFDSVVRGIPIPNQQPAPIRDETNGNEQHRSDPLLRRQAADNLKALGPVAVAAVPELANAALNDDDTGVKRAALAALGEIGMPNATGVLGPYNQAVDALGQTLLRTGDPETAKAAEDSLLKLLPVVGKRLTMDNAILLLQVHESGNKRVAPAINSAWAAKGVTQDAVVKEMYRRALAITKAKVAKQRRNARAYDGYKPPWELWREAHPAEAELEIQKAAAQTRDNQKRLDGIQFTTPPPATDAQKAADFELRRARMNGAAAGN
jgi:hypothetical protein